ncbi:MAG: glycosyl hydrolase [Blastocatellia bacterium]
MNFLCRPVLAALLVASISLLVAFARQSSSPITELQHQFRNPPDDTRIMMRWWWFGPTVTKAELEREMRLMKAGGIGGFEIQPVYPVVLDDASKGLKTLPYLSDEFLDALRFTNEQARELGLRVDLTVGTGWPYGGPSVPVTEAAGRLRVERVKVTQRRAPIPSIAEGEKLLGAFAGQREIAELKDGAAHLPSDLTAQNEVSFFIASRTGQQVKRAAVGGEGFVLDHYDRVAVERYLKNTGDRLMQAFGAKPPHAIFCDSLEVFNSDWIADFLEEFQKRRGYDLRPLLPALIPYIGDIGPQTAAVRHDWGQTLTEVFTDRFLTPMRDWAKRNNTKFRIQGYGIPPMTLSGNALADLPEGEGSQWKVVRAARWASSASHLYGKPVTSSETWTWLHSPSFRATPLDVKAEADLHFLQGVNQLIGHGWPYSPEGIEYPGWRFYAAGVFNEKNPWWIVMPDLARYLQRISFLMRQGAPANDVALYLPNHDAWAGYTSGKVHYLIEALRDQVGADVMPAILESGFNLDFFDDDAIRNIGRVENGALVLGANRYRAVVLPNVERIPLETLKTLEKFAAGGGAVIATRRIPNVAPGLKASEAEKNQIRTISARLFDGPMAKGHFVREEKSALGEKLAFLLQSDVAFNPTAPEVGFVHRRTENAEIYFVANTSNTRQVVQATFRVPGQETGMKAEQWDPMTGQTSPVEALAQSPRSVTLQLRLDPYASQVFVFAPYDQAAPAALPMNTRLLDLSSDWKVTFGGSGGVVNMEKFRSWTEDEATRNYSGTATYEKTFAMPETVLQGYQEILLDFGEGKALPPEPRGNGMRAWLDAPIREAAVVYVNDIRAGSVWRPPYLLNIKNYLKPGENRLRITVANTAINHLAGRRQPDYKLLNLRYGERFQPQDMENLQPLPSGLLGDVQLLAR